MALVLDGVTYIYQQTGRGVENVSLRAPRGEWTALVGRSGSGKSTLLRIIAGLLPPQRGTVSFPAIAEGKPAGLVLQFPEHHFFAATVSDELAFALKGSGLSKAAIQAEVHAALTAVGIDSDAVAQQSPFQLSTSQQRLVAIAAALIQKPAFLLLDEPGAGLDPRKRAAMFEQLDNWRRASGSGIILSTHDMDEVARWADRVVAIADGRVIASESADEFTFAWAGAHRLGIPSTSALLMKIRELGGKVPPFARTPEEAAHLVLRRLQSMEKGKV